MFSYARSVIRCYPNSSCDGSVFNAEDRLTPQTAKSGYLEGSVSQPGTYSIKITPYRNTLINSATEFEFVIGSNGKFEDSSESATWRAGSVLVMSEVLDEQRVRSLFRAGPGSVTTIQGSSYTDKNPEAELSAFICR